MDDMRPPQLPEQPVDVVRAEHLTRLLRICEGRDFASRRDTIIIILLLLLLLLLLLVDTGMPRAECAGMTLDDVDLDQRIVWVLGKGRRPRALPIGRKPLKHSIATCGPGMGIGWAHLPQLWVGRNGPMTPSGIYGPADVRVHHRAGRPRPAQGRAGGPGRGPGRPAGRADQFLAGAQAGFSSLDGLGPV
jgi:integrase